MPKKALNPKSIKPLPSVGQRLIDGLTELRDTLQAGTQLEKQFTVRTVQVADPEQFDARRIQALRAQLKVSQPVFARLLGISTVLAQSWEQGTRVPSPLARRLLMEMERDPRHWRQMIVTVPSGSPRHRKSA